MIINIYFRGVFSSKDRLTDPIDSLPWYRYPYHYSTMVIVIYIKYRIKYVPYFSQVHFTPVFILIFMMINTRSNPIKNFAVCAGVRMFLNSSTKFSTCEVFKYNCSRMSENLTNKLLIEKLIYTPLTSSFHWAISSCIAVFIFSNCLTSRCSSWVRMTMNTTTIQYRLAPYPVAVHRKDPYLFIYMKVSTVRWRPKEVPHMNREADIQYLIIKVVSSIDSFFSTSSNTKSNINIFTLTYLMESRSKFISV